MLARHSSRPSAVVQHRSIQLKGQRFHYFVWGEPGPPIVFLHGTGFHGYVWKPIAQRLSRHGRVLALDQRGHGDSCKPDDGYTFDDFADDLFHFLTALQLADVTAVGHSAGATAIALCAAAHPGIIDRAVLIDPILFPRPAGRRITANPLAHRARKRRMLWDSRGSMFQAYRSREPFKTWRDEVLWAYINEGTVLRANGQIELKCPGALEARMYESAPQVDGFSRLGQVDLPVLILRGASSDAFSPASATRAVALLPQGRLQTIARTTHFAPMERPDAVARAVREFLRR